MKMRAFLAALLALLALAATPMTAGAQTISQPLDSSVFVGGAGVGQSFVATTTGSVVGIDVRNRSSVVAILHLYNGANGSNVPADVGVPAYSQTGITLTAVASPLFSHITLTTPFPVVAGNTYTFVLDGPTTIQLFFRFGDVIPGTRISGFNGVASTEDIAFQIYEVAAAVTPVGAAAIPTLSQWAMLLLGLMLVGGGALRLGRSGDPSTGVRGSDQVFDRRSAVPTSIIPMLGIVSAGSVVDPAGVNPPTTRMPLPLASTSGPLS